jgi:tetratricopeptide (TPR) repeat protein
LLERFAESEATPAVYFTAWACSLAPDAVDDYDLALRLARRAVAQQSDSQQYRTGLGAVLLRAGKFAEAKTELRNALEHGEDSVSSTAYTLYLLAITEHHLGNDHAARRHLDAAEAKANAELEGAPSWNRRITLELLRREAASLIDPSPDSTKEDD